MVRNHWITKAALAAALLGGGASFARAQDPAAQTPGQDPAPPPNPPTSTAAPTAPVVTVSGNLETYYTYNFNKPDNRNNGFIFNNRDREFGLNYVDLRVGKAATPESRAGFFIRLIEGDVKNLAIAEDDGDTDNLLEAYGTLLVPLGRNGGRELKVDAGQFVTHVGYETIELGTNNFFSRSFLFAIPEPFYHAGVRATLGFGARTTATGLILNRYNGRSDPENRDLAFGLQVTQALSGTSSLIFNALTARESFVFVTGEDTLGVSAERAARKRSNLLGRRAALSAHGLGWRRPATRGRQTVITDSAQVSILNLIYTSQRSPNAPKFALEGVYRFTNSDDSELGGDIYGAAGYGVFTLGNGNNLGLRAEYLNLKNGAAYNGDNQDLYEATLSYELRSNLFAGARTLLELRYDGSSDEIFADGDSSRKDQITFTIGQAFSF